MEIIISNKYKLGNLLGEVCRVLGVVLNYIASIFDILGIINFKYRDVNFFMVSILKIFVRCLFLYINSI